MSDIKDLKEKIHHLRVLFVDDDEQIQKMTGIFLRKFFDFVVVAKNGEEGLNTFLEYKDFDIVIADIKMPIMDGITMVKKIKEVKSDIFVVFITASRGEKECSESLYDLYIQKPISFEDIISIMEKVSE